MHYTQIANFVIITHEKSIFQIRCKLRGCVVIACVTSNLVQEKLVGYILACQDEETGGFSDRPGDIVCYIRKNVYQLFNCFILQVDPYHTLFGLAGLSLLGNDQIKSINPVFCMPQYLIEKLNCVPKLLD